MTSRPRGESKRLSILLLCDDRPGNANTILDHIDAFSRYSRHQVRTFNPVDMAGSLALDLGEFDAVVIHYSLVLSHERYVSRRFREKLRRFRGLKVQFIQDEYRWVDRTTAASRDVGVNLLFTAAPEPAAGQLYDIRLPGVPRVHTLTGYVAENLRHVPQRPLHERALDVGYRGRDLPFWLGRLSQEKQWIAQGFRQRAPKYDLRTDIGWLEEDRIYGARWVEFLGNSRATLGSESGASIADFDGSVERAVRRYLAKHPGATFDDVTDAVLRPYEGNVIVNVVSPRVFEAASLGTALIMFPGDYSGVVRPDEHYIALAKDFSNLDDVAAKVRDETFMKALTEHAHDDIVESDRWSYRTFMQQFDDVVAQQIDGERGPRPARRHRLATMERAFRVPPPGLRVIRAAVSTVSTVRGRNFARQSDLESGAFIYKGSMALRAAIGDSDLRPIFREGRRMRLPTNELLDEVFKLSVLRSAALGQLRADEPFGIGVRFDEAAGSITFVSNPPAQAEESAALPPRALEMLRAGGVNAITWDHTPIDEIIRVLGGRVVIGVGPAGVKNYPLSVEIGRRRPELIERALAPFWSGHRTQLGAVR